MTPERLAKIKTIHPTILQCSCPVPPDYTALLTRIAVGIERAAKALELIYDRMAR